MSKVSIKLAELQEDILGIIEDPWVSLGSKSATEVSQPSVNHKSCSSHRMTLLEIACLGNPEQTLQGEILHGLRCLGWTVVQEAGYLLGPRMRRHLDLLVFYTDNINTDEQLGSEESYAHKKPLCIIEMKHLSSHQAPPSSLTAGLDKDYGARIKGIPIMHLGFYTTVNRIAPWPLTSTGFYRFLKTYCKGYYPQNRMFYAIVTAWKSVIKNWLVPPAISVVNPANDRFQFMDGGKIRTVEGHVEFFVGIRP